MADNSGPSALLGLILGVVVVLVVLVFAFGWWPGADRGTDVTVTTPPAEAPSPPAQSPSPPKGPDITPDNK